MVGRGGTRRGSIGLGAGDALAILLVIALLSCTLGALVASRDSRFVARTQYGARVLLSQLNPSWLSPNQASAEAPPARK